MNNLRYRLTRTPTQPWLEENHFYASQPYEMYIHRFNVWRISETSAAYCEIRLDVETNEVEMDIYEAPHTFYGLWYAQMWGLEEQDTEFQTIQRRIEDVFDRLGIVEDPEHSKPVPELHHMEYWGKEKAA